MNIRDIVVSLGLCHEIHDKIIHRAKHVFDKLSYLTCYPICPKFPGTGEFPCVVFCADIARMEDLSSNKAM